MTLISYISVPVVNRNNTQYIKIDLNTNLMYFKDNNGHYVLIDDIRQLAQDAKNSVDEEGDDVDDEADEADVDDEGDEEADDMPDLVDDDEDGCDEYCCDEDDCHDCSCCNYSKNDIIEFIKICEQELQQLSMKPIISFEETNRKAELQSIIADFSGLVKNVD
jgi:hypothetical protein